jgi:hypothetical protein
MPSQRSPYKAQIGAYIDAQMKLRILQASQRLGITTTQFMLDALEAYLRLQSPAWRRRPRSSRP